MEIDLSYSLGWVIPILALALGMAWWLYSRNSIPEDWPKWLRPLLLSARAILLFFLSLFLLEPILKYFSERIEKPVILFLEDTSESVSFLEDSSYISETWARVREEVLSELEEKYQVERYSFADGLIEDSSNSQKLTHLSAALKELGVRYGGSNIGAILVASDGQVNRGQDPVYASYDLTAPVYTIGFGSNTSPRDQAINRLEANSVVYLGNDFPVRINFSASNLAGERAVLKLYQSGQKVSESEFGIESDFQSFEKEFKLMASAVGVQKIAVELELLDNEWSAENNRREIYVEVLDGRQRVLILSRSYHPDVGAIKASLNQSDNYECDAFTWREIRDKRPEDLVKTYNLLIAHELPFSEAGSRELVENLAVEGFPIWLITGLKTEMRFLNALKTGVNIGTNKFQSNEAGAVFNENFSLFQSEFPERWLEECPPLISPFGAYSQSGGTEVLFTQRIGNLSTNQALLFFNVQGSKKLAVLLGEGIWRWKLYDYQKNGDHEVFNQLIRKSVRFLASREEKKQFQLNIARSFSDLEEVKATAEVYNKSYERTEQAEVKLHLRKEDGSEFIFDFQKLDGLFKLNMGSLEPGLYQYEANTQVSGQAFTEKGDFLVRATSLERSVVKADHDLLQRWSNETGGKFYPARETASLASDVLANEEIVEVAHSEEKFRSLIDFKWIFFLFLALLSLEWFLRKLNGTV
jgi:hypothetical protein